MLKLYDFTLSGNCHKVRLLLSMLKLDYESVPVNLATGEHKTPSFIELNPCGQVPVLVDGNVTLRDSQAILVSPVKVIKNWLIYSQSNGVSDPSF